MEKQPNSFLLLSYSIINKPDETSLMIIKTEKDEFIDFLTDAANFKGAADAVYFPEKEKDIISILKKSNAKGIKVTVAGNGTGLTGARVPQGGVVVSTSKMNKIIKINKKEKFAIVQPGVLLKDLQAAVEAVGLFYPPDPTERDSFIGGNIATNASGARTFKYGPTRNYVLGLNVVLPGGDTIVLERGKNIAQNYKLEITTTGEKQILVDVPQYRMPDTKHTAGYFAKENADAIDLFIGSEGTLGIISEAKLRLLDLPEGFISSVIFFREEISAISFITQARKYSYISRAEKSDCEIDARGLEFFDENALTFMREVYPSIPAFAKSAVWFEQEHNGENEKSLLDKWTSLIETHNGDTETAWFAFNKTDYEKLKEFRHSIAARVNEFCASKGLMKVGTDTAVPYYKFEDYYIYCKRVIAKAGLNYVAYGHAGDSHIHFNMLPLNKDQYNIAKSVYENICKRASDVRGTISAEHGIGKLKKDYLYDMYGEGAIMQMAKMKSQFDPKSILGIGNIFDEKYLIS